MYKETSPGARIDWPRRPASAKASSIGGTTDSGARVASIRPSANSSGGHSWENRTPRRSRRGNTCIASRLEDSRSTSIQMQFADSASKCGNVSAKNPSWYSTT